MLLFATAFIVFPCICAFYLITEPSEDWKGDLFFLFLLGIPIFLAGLFGFFPMFLHYAFGKEEIFIGKDGKESYLSTGFGRKKRKVLFDWNAVTNISQKTVKTSSGKNSRRTSPKIEKFIVIKLKEKTVKDFGGRPTNEIVLGHNLTEKQKDFVLSALQYFHKNTLSRNQCH